jgi:hypothetical protein
MIDYWPATEIARQRHQELIRAAQKECQLRELQNGEQSNHHSYAVLTIRLLGAIRRLKLRQHVKRTAVP